MDVDVDADGSHIRLAREERCPLHSSSFPHTSRCGKHNLLNVVPWEYNYQNSPGKE